MIKEVGSLAKKVLKVFKSQGYEIKQKSKNSQVEIKASRDDRKFIFAVEQTGSLNGYSLYDSYLKFYIDSKVFLYNLSERTIECIESDKNDIEMIIISLTNSNYHYEKIRNLVFFKKTYLVLNTKENEAEIGLLQVK